MRGGTEPGIMAGTASRAVGNDELAALRRLALDGGFEGETKVSCSALADRLDVSSQTASRRLQGLEDAALIDRRTVSDGQWIAITDDGERALRREYEAYRRLFEDEIEVSLSGWVTGGMGEGRHYISLPGYMEQFEERLGYAPFPGTLNVDLTDESVRRRGALESFDPIQIEGWEDDERTYGPAVCYLARIEVEHAADERTTYDDAHVIAPERTHHDEDQLEVIAPEKLRDALGLSDGDRVTIRVGERP